ncbi:type II toxin-antitoxin system RelB/ParD family antitoxin [Lactococcus kimchii]|uniref:type II toxin-antitoxin system RelB/ParD family antitoxin n=1 Tax=Lactococcus sp. S-13 TaxID=2507158 RepID=UPI001023A725|nr:type II toxin-antitoxin system RelB/DinJ family antitoxin [Lactococcus sp. S-13]RZI47840.1 toxin-antitoxin system antitoxin subunit [Lactococcus sp. S-13]
MLLADNVFEKNTQVNFKTNDELLRAAKQIFAKKNLDITSTFNLFLQNVVAKEELPFETEAEIRRTELIEHLQKDIQQSIRNYEMGLGVSEQEARERFGL